MEPVPHPKQEEMEAHSAQASGLHQTLRWWPFPPGDPAPEIWRVISDLDKRAQLEVAQVVLQTQIETIRAHAQGLEQIKAVVAKGIGR